MILYHSLHESKMIIRLTTYGLGLASLLPYEVIDHILSTLDEDELQVISLINTCWKLCAILNIRTIQGNGYITGMSTYVSEYYKNFYPHITAIRPCINCNSFQELERVIALDLQRFHVRYCPRKKERENDPTQELLEVLRIFPRLTSPKDVIITCDCGNIATMKWCDGKISVEGYVDNESINDLFLTLPFKDRALKENMGGIFFHAPRTNNHPIQLFFPRILPR